MRSSFFLDPYGNIYPCHIFDEKAANIMEIEYSIPNLFKSESTRELRNRIKNSECPECWTPCEAYQTILSNFFNYKNLRELMRIH
jgi:radical SAM protein with 4Fe4S-binding SPASM domain